MRPFKISPAFKDYLWGGTRLRDEYGKQCDFPRVAESWELSCHKDGLSKVAGGAYAGLTLPEYLEKTGPAVLGTGCAKFDGFPILIKFIDAKDNLSVQVHPTNDYAQRVEGEFGKTEMWYVVDCEPGATLVYGFTKELDEGEFRRRIADNTLMDVLNLVPVHKGDTFFIPAGTLHGIGKGILIAEIQQNSNSTYRVYDYGRVGTDGKPRALHIDKAVDVTELCPPKRPVGPQGGTVEHDGYTEALLASCEYFTVREVTLKTAFSDEADETSFHNILNLTDEAVLCCDGEEMALKPGDSVFVPAGTGAYTLKGSGRLLITTV